MTFLQILWFILIFVLITGYFVLDGFDLGIGSLYTVLGKSEKEKATLRRAVGPVWDGNEVWLLTAGGALFAAFAPAYATTFSGFYLAIMLVLFGLIIRAVSIEFRVHDKDHGGMWDILFFIGSIVPALLFGVAIGNVLNGLPLNANGDYMGSFFALLNPFALVCGLVGLAQFMVQGLTWTAVKTEPGDLHDRAVDLRFKLQIAVVVLFALASILYFTIVNPTLAAGIPATLRIVFVVVIVAAAVLGILFGKKGDSADLMTFFMSCLMCVGLVGLVAASLFPNIVPATDAMYSITVANAASSELALTCMTVITCIGLPLVLVYHFIVYRTFAGKITDDDLEDY